MPRPVKRKKVCCLPETNLFGPLNAKNMDDGVITMSVEEYETLRLIDLEGMLQEECAENMKVARTTVQHIYNDARKKLTEALVNGIVLKIEGGNYKLCEEGQQAVGCGRCRRQKINEALEQSKKSKK